MSEEVVDPSWHLSPPVAGRYLRMDSIESHGIAFNEVVVEVRDTHFGTWLEVSYNPNDSVRDKVADEKYRDCVWFGPMPRRGDPPAEFVVSAINRRMAFKPLPKAGSSSQFNVGDWNWLPVEKAASRLHWPSGGLDKGVK